MFGLDWRTALGKPTDDGYHPVPTAPWDGIAMTDGPLAAYRALTRERKLRHDPAQELAAEKLQSLHNALRGYEPSSGQGGWRDMFGMRRRREAPPQGLYLFGGVGRGKSMLMDLFFDTAPVEKKRRTHFHAFMLEVHDRWHRWREERGSRRTANRDEDPMPFLARSMADSGWLLCFDEFHVVDVADAMILGRLFTALFDLGVVIVATSNWPPDDLYKDGLQRARFLPFIDLLKERMDVLELDSGLDYRMARLRQHPVYHQPLGRASSRALAHAFDELTDSARGRADSLQIKGRTIPVPRTARGVAWFAYEDLCEQPLGAADYLAIAERFKTVIIDGVPRFGEAKRNQAKRFMTLIDALYEHRTKAVIAAEAEPQRLFDTESHAFELDRTVSRLMEMQSAEYLEAPHLT